MIKTPVFKKDWHLLVKIAFWSGLLPLILGTVVFLLWALTKSSVWFTVGTIIIYTGMVSCFAGIACCGIYVIVQLRRKASGWLKDVVVALLVILLNIPAVSMYFQKTSAIMSSVVLEFVNQSNVTVDSIEIYVDDTKKALLRDLKRDEARKIDFDPRDEGAVRIVINMDGKSIRQDVLGYITNLSGGSAVIFINKDSSVSVEQIRN